MQNPIILITGKDETLRRSLKSLLVFPGLTVSDAADQKAVEQSLETSGVNPIVSPRSKEDHRPGMRTLTTLW